MSEFRPIFIVVWNIVAMSSAYAQAELTLPPTNSISGQTATFISRSMGIYFNAGIDHPNDGLDCMKGMVGVSWFFE